MASRWYYQMLMEEFGPITVEQLRELFEDGTLSEADLVRSEPGDVWTTVAAVKPLLFASDLPARAMEEIGDLSELAFEFEDSGPTARRGAYTQGSTEDAPQVSMEPVPGSLRQNPGLIAADSVSPVSSPRVLAPQVPTSDQPAEEWFCESFGQVLGPLSLAELIGLGESGALDARDRVRCGVRGIWKTVDCLPSVMRAIAVGRAIEVDPAVVSVTTQKHSGDAGSATPANATRVPVEPMAEQPQQSAANEPDFALSAEPAASIEQAAAVQRQEPETVSTKPRSRNPRTKRRRNAKGEEELLDEIFDDVFNDDSPPARSNAAAQSNAASSATASGGSSMNSTPPTVSPQNPIMTAANSASASQESSRAAGARLTAAAMAVRPSSKGSRSSFDVNPATIGILVAVMLVAAGGWYVWQNGIPGFSGSSNGTGTFDSAGAVKALQATMDRYKALAANPSESEWKEFSNATTKEMSALFNSVYAQSGATPKGAACLAATMCLMKIAKAQPDNKEFIDKNLAEFERQIVLVTK